MHHASGTFPYKLTYHSFHPITRAHISEHMGLFLWENVKREQRAEAFKLVTSELQFEALMLYFFSCLEDLPNPHPYLAQLTPALLSICNSILGPTNASNKVCPAVPTNDCH